MDRTSSAGEILRVSIPVRQANALFNANYTEFLSHETSTTLVRTLSYSIPAEVDKHLDYIYPTNQYVPVHRRIAAADAYLLIDSFCLLSRNLPFKSSQP